MTVSVLAENGIEYLPNTKDLEGSGSCLINVLYRYLPGRTEENRVTERHPVLSLQRHVMEHVTHSIKPPLRS
jgi:hypothetical protein